MILSKHFGMTKTLPSYWLRFLNELLSLVGKKCVTYGLLLTSNDLVTSRSKKCDGERKEKN